MSAIIAAVIVAVAVLVASVILSNALRDFAGSVRDGLREHGEDLVKAQNATTAAVETRARETGDALGMLYQAVSWLRSAARDYAPAELVRAREKAEEKAGVERQKAARALQAAINATQVEVKPDELMDAAALRGFQRGVTQHAEAVRAELKNALPDPVAVAS